MVDHQAAMAGRLRDALQAAGWQIANDTPLPLVCVTRADLTDDAIAAVARAVVAEGQAWISDVRLPDGRRWLRACITHHDTQPADVAALVEALHRAAGARSRASAG
jgi:aromatic-L-amino-acid decarboxylase